MSAPCDRPHKTGTCIERLADGWISPQDLCPSCTRTFMTALDAAAGPLQWHPNYIERATNS